MLSLMSFKWEDENKCRNTYCDQLPLEFHQWKWGKSQLVRWWPFPWLVGIRCKKSYEQWWWRRRRRWWRCTIRKFNEILVIPSIVNDIKMYLRVLKGKINSCNRTLFKYLSWSQNLYCLCITRRNGRTRKDSRTFKKSRIKRNFYQTRHSDGIAFFVGPLGDSKIYFL